LLELESDLLLWPQLPPDALLNEERRRIMVDAAVCLLHPLEQARKRRFTQFPTGYRSRAR
jgi:hypothetical protein